MWSERRTKMVLCLKYFLFCHSINKLCHSAKNKIFVVIWAINSINLEQTFGRTLWLLDLLTEPKMCCVKTGREGAESLCLYYDDMRQKIFVELDKLGLDGRTNIVTPSAPDGAKKMCCVKNGRRRRWALVWTVLYLFVIWAMEKFTIKHAIVGSCLAPESSAIVWSEIIKVPHQYSS